MFGNGCIEIKLAGDTFDDSLLIAQKYCDAQKAHFSPRNNLVSSIVYSAQASDVKTVLVSGKILMENYEVKTINHEETILKSEEMAFDLIKRSQS